MHDTVAKIRRAIRDGVLFEGIPEMVSERLQAAGLARALAEPLGSHFEMAYREALRWTQLAQDLAGTPESEPPAVAFRGLVYASEHLETILGDLVPFLERAEDSLGERDEITHRESAYEREVAPFGRLDSTQALREFLARRAGFSAELAGIGAQAEGDLMKLIYLEQRLRIETPKAGDLYAMVVELALDSKRHLIPAFSEGSSFLNAMKAAASQ